MVIIVKVDIGVVIVGVNVVCHVANADQLGSDLGDFFGLLQPLVPLEY